jgi:hypothetical protein
MSTSILQTPNEFELYANSWTVDGDVYGNSIINGSIGLIGPIGPQGISLAPIGLIGKQGSIGPQGNIGLQGEIGLIGQQSSQGQIGIQGPTGSQGIDGNVGLQGNAGDIGPIGNNGVIITPFSTPVGGGFLSPPNMTGQFVLKGNIFTICFDDLTTSGGNTTYAYTGSGFIPELMRPTTGSLWFYLPVMKNFGFGMGTLEIRTNGTCIFYGDTNMGGFSGTYNGLYKCSVTYTI